MTTPSKPSTNAAPDIDPWTAFGLGVLGGVAGGLLLISLGSILLALVMLVFVAGLALRPPFGAAGILGGWGATWLALLAAATARCDPASCVGPDLTPWLTFAGGLVAVAAGLVLIGVGRPAWSLRAARGLRATGASRWLRAAGATVIGVAAGLTVGTFWTGGWAIGALATLPVVWTRRSRERRVEIVWFAIGFVGALALAALR